MKQGVDRRVNDSRTSLYNQGVQQQPQYSKEVHKLMVNMAPTLVKEKAGKYNKDSVKLHQKIEALSTAK